MPLRRPLTISKTVSARHAQPSSAPRWAGHGSAVQCVQYGPVSHVQRHPGACFAGGVRHDPGLQPTAETWHLSRAVRDRWLVFTLAAAANDDLGHREVGRLGTDRHDGGRRSAEIPARSRSWSAPSARRRGCVRGDATATAGVTTGLGCQDSEPCRRPPVDGRRGPGSTTFAHGWSTGRVLGSMRQARAIRTPRPAAPS
jgi:hypothetical protein